MFSCGSEFVVSPRKLLRTMSPGHVSHHARTRFYIHFCKTPRKIFWMSDCCAHQNTPPTHYNLFYPFRRGVKYLFTTPFPVHWHSYIEDDTGSYVFKNLTPPPPKKKHVHGPLHGGSSPIGLGNTCLVLSFFFFKDLQMYLNNTNLNNIKVWLGS